MDASSKQINSTVASDYDAPNVSIQGASGEFASVANDTSEWDSVTIEETINQ